jgi:hypothetical protein
VFQEDPKFNLAGDIVQVQEGVSPRKNVELDPLDGARFLSLSVCHVVDLIHPTFSGVTMVLSKDKNLAKLFSKVSKMRYQQIKKNVEQG